MDQAGNPDHDPVPTKRKLPSRLCRIRGREKFLHNSLLLDSGYLAEATTDVKFVCDSGKVVRAHKVALCLASKYFTTILHDQNTSEISSIFIPDISAEVLIAILTMVYKREEFLIPQGLEDQVTEWLYTFDLSDRIAVEESSGSNLASVPFHPPGEVEGQGEPSSPPPLQNTTDQLENDSQNASLDHCSQASNGNPLPLEPQSREANSGEPPEQDNMMDTIDEPMPGTSQQGLKQLAPSEVQNNGNGTAAGAHSSKFKTPHALNNDGQSATPRPMPVATGEFPDMGPPAPKRGKGISGGQPVSPKQATPPAGQARAKSASPMPRARSASPTLIPACSWDRSRNRDRSNEWVNTFYIDLDLDDEAQDYRGKNMAKLLGEDPKGPRLRAKLAKFNRENGAGEQ